MIPHAYIYGAAGPDIYENIKPICVQCNIDDKEFPTTFDFMVSIGTMIPEDVAPTMAKIRLVEKTKAEDPESFWCNVAVAGAKKKSNAYNSCPRPKYPGSLRCKTHSKHEKMRKLKNGEQICQDIIQHIQTVVKINWSVLDDEEKDAFIELLECSKDEIALIIEKHGPQKGVKFR
tara:strand:+ start:8743 stop:9267 length:525 start_codon:yes stop_codon:yes gene_type:complete